MIKLVVNLRDIYCGLLICNINSSVNFNPDLSNMRFYPAAYSHRLGYQNDSCTALYYNVLGAEDPGYVPNGAACGQNRVTFIFLAYYYYYYYVYLFIYCVYWC